jgi:hypothetical protein
MAQHPEPIIFQGHSLLDLPPEILDRVMELARIEHIMRFSKTCRSLRPITLRYVFQVCLFRSWSISCLWASNSAEY